MTDDVGIPKRVADASQKLRTVAAQLNVVSDELAKPISILDVVLKELNLGVSAWQRYESNEDEFGNFSYREIGYARVGSKWGIALRSVEGNNEASPDRESVETWLFNDAPRALRVESVDFLPLLIEKLTAEATATVDKIQGQISKAQQVVEGIGGPPARKLSGAEQQLASLLARSPEVSKAHPPVTPLKGAPFFETASAPKPPRK